VTCMNMLSGRRIYLAWTKPSCHGVRKAAYTTWRAVACPCKKIGGNEDVRLTDYQLVRRGLLPFGAADRSRPAHALVRVPVVSFGQFACVAQASGAKARPLDIRCQKISDVGANLDHRITWGFDGT
jgi:hypothetical protein